MGLALAWGLLLTGCGAPAAQKPEFHSVAEGTPQTIKRGKLAIVSNLNYVPLVVEEADGTRTGFGTELCDDIAEILGLTIDPLFTDSQAGVFEQVLAGTDADLGGTIYELGALPDGLISSNDVMSADLAVVVRDGTNVLEDETDFDHLQGTVLVQNVSVARDWAEAHLEEGSYQLEIDPTVILQALRENRAPAGVVEQTVALYYLESIYTALKVAFTVETGWSIGYVTKAENEKLLTAVNEALAELRDDGTIDSLEARWFGTVL